MVSEEHQKLVNDLARVMEKQGITITHIDIDGTPEYFDAKYRSLPKPSERDGHTPDLEGMKGVSRHFGEAKTTIKDDPNIDSQIRAFTNREMNGKDIPLHLAVPQNLKKEMEKKLYKMHLYEKYKKGAIMIWA